MASDPYPGAVTESREPRQPGPALAATVGVPVLAVLAGLTTLHACVPASGGAARVGLTLALIRPDDGCPPGTFGITAAGQALAVAVAATAPVLAGHLLLLVGVLGLFRAIRAVGAAVAARLRVGVVPEPAILLPSPARCSVVASPTLGAGSRGLVVRPYRRGPPLPLGAG